MASCINHCIHVEGLEYEKPDWLTARNGHDRCTVIIQTSILY